jgi:hypothetical protein
MWAGVLDILVVSNTMDMLHSGTWGTMLAWIGLAVIAVQLDQVRVRARRTRSEILPELPSLRPGLNPR